jgi:hypothetical protein
MKIMKYVGLIVMFYGIIGLISVTVPTLFNSYLSYDYLDYLNPFRESLETATYIYSIVFTVLGLAIYVNRK